jgi:hypothetical protein
MKKTFLLLGFAALISLASCKKDYVCECTFSSNGVASDPDETTYVGVTKSAARANCVSTNSSYTIQGTTYNSTNTCKLK